MGKIPKKITGNGQATRAAATDDRRSHSENRVTENPVSPESVSEKIDSSTTKTASDSIELSVETPPLRATRKDSGKSHRKRKSVEAEEPEAWQRIADTMCASLSAIAIMVTQNQQADMTPEEQTLIKPPLIATLQNLGDTAKEKIEQFGNPVMLLAGLGLWALRLSSLKPEKHAVNISTAANSALTTVPSFDSAVKAASTQQPSTPLPPDGVAHELRGRLGEA